MTVDVPIDHFLACQKPTVLLDASDHPDPPLQDSNADDPKYSGLAQIF